MVKLLSLVLSALLSGNAFAESHFRFANGEPIDDLKSAWELVDSHLSGFTPLLIKVEIRPVGPSMFNLPDLIVIDQTAWDNRRLSVVAHETAHLALGAKTAGVSATNPFRFIDEGLASIIGEEMKGSLPRFERQAWCEAKNQLNKNNLSIGLVQNWKEYFRSNWNWYAYDVGASFVLFVQSRFSKSKFSEMIEEIGNNSSLSLSIVKVFGESLEDFEKKWIQSINEESTARKCE